MYVYLIETNPLNFQHHNKVHHVDVVENGWSKQTNKQTSIHLYMCTMQSHLCRLIPILNAQMFSALYKLLLRLY